jgi:hypothetical protein
MIVSVMYLLLAAPTPVLPPVLPYPKSGSFECTVRGRDDSPIRIRGDLGVPSKADEGVQRGRARLTVEGDQSLSGVYFSEWHGADLELASKSWDVSVTLKTSANTGGVIILRENAPFDDPKRWLAGVCSTSFSNAPGEVIQ